MGVDQKDALDNKRVMPGYIVTGVTEHVTEQETVDTKTLKITYEGVFFKVGVTLENSRQMPNKIVVGVVGDSFFNKRMPTLVDVVARVNKTLTPAPIVSVAGVNNTLTPTPIVSGVGVSRVNNTLTPAPIGVVNN